MEVPNEKQIEDKVPLMAYNDGNDAGKTSSSASTIDLENGYFSDFHKKQKQNMSQGKWARFVAKAKKGCTKKNIMETIGCIATLVQIYNIVIHATKYNNKSSNNFDTISQEYLNVLNSSNQAAEWSKEFTKAPHLAGTNLDLVNWQASKYKEFGLSNVHIEDFDVYINYPVEHALKLLSDKQKDGTDYEVIYEPSLVEDQLDEDPTTQGDDLVPSFHGYSANGNVTAEYIYANYGTLQDFELLASQGVDINGKIVIVRYGGIFRGLKVKFAQQYGAAGVLIYSEPSDDGEITEDNGYKAYPDGPARNPSSLQRGSVQFLSQIPGDPTTPGWPSKGDHVKRVDPHSSIPKIPSLPISYKEVQPILAQLNGHGIKFDESKGWDGSLHNVSYNVGPNPNLKLNLYNNQTYNISKLWNVYGEIEGHLKNEVVLLGNHRDAWIKGGAGDPNSGSAVTLEIIRALQHLQTKFGWKPLRTIKFASWDGEEYGLIGSTEFGEYYHKELQQKVVAYLNLDVATTGKRLKLQGSPLLYDLLNRNAKKILYPAAEDVAPSDQESAPSTAAAGAATLFDHFYKHHKQISILGSGSDFTVFLEHLGIPSLDLGFTPGPQDPIYHYHSNYDSFHWMSEFADPGFVFHNTMARYLGLLTLDVAQNRGLKFGLVENAELLSKFFNETAAKIPDSWLNQTTVVSKCGGSMRSSSSVGSDAKVEDEAADANEAIDEINAAEYKELLQVFEESGIESDLISLVSHTDNKRKTKNKKTIAQTIELIQRSIAKFISTSDTLQTQLSLLEDELTSLESSTTSNHWWNPAFQLQKYKLLRQIAKLNLKIKYLERLFLHYGGLKGRPWFRHVVYASGRNTGYAGQALPGLAEAIEDGVKQDVVKWLWILEGSVRKAERWLRI